MLTGPSWRAVEEGVLRAILRQCLGVFLGAHLGAHLGVSDPCNLVGHGHESRTREGVTVCAFLAEVVRTLGAHSGCAGAHLGWG